MSGELMGQCFSDPKFIIRLGNDGWSGWSGSVFKLSPLVCKGIIDEFQEMYGKYREMRNSTSQKTIIWVQKTWLFQKKIYIIVTIY